MAESALPEEHSVDSVLLTPARVQMLRPGDYTHGTVGALSVTEVRSPGEPAEHMARLIADVRSNGIQQPIIVAAPDMLVDGHHRAVLAVELGVPCPALIIHCYHPLPRECKQVLALCERQHEITRETGWEWVPEG